VIHRRQGGAARVTCLVAQTREVPMRSFIFACIAVAVIAVVGAAVLSEFQESSKEAFSTDAVRL
jgi:hypothetical protein